MQGDYTMYEKVVVGKNTISPIDWEMTPDLSFGTYESWGGRERVRNNSERVYYFFVDNWGEEPKVCLMERGIKHAKVLAEIDVPLQLIKQCIEGQGDSSWFEKSYAIDDNLKQWLKDNVLEVADSPLIKPLEELSFVENMGTGLPTLESEKFEGEVVTLPSGQGVYRDEDVAEIIKKWNFYDGDLNTGGSFENNLVSCGKKGVIVDQRTALMWQTHGLEISSLRTMNRMVEELNEKGFAGFNDWRLPSIEEAMSLMDQEANFKDIHLQDCFSKEQPFIFVAAQRKPGGCWFVDYKHGRAFWSSGTIPGGFGRLCRSF
jgi:hypothetical protein